MNHWINLHALGQILVAGLICGAGLPAIFTLGLRALSVPGTRQPAPAEGDRLAPGHAVRIAAAGACFAIAVLGVGWGIYFIVSGG